MSDRKTVEQHVAFDINIEHSVNEVIQILQDLQSRHKEDLYIQIDTTDTSGITPSIDVLRMAPESDAMYNQRKHMEELDEKNEEAKEKDQLKKLMYKYMSDLDFMDEAMKETTKEAVRKMQQRIDELVLEAKFGDG